MNKYRVSYQYDDFNKCVCLQCKNEFTCHTTPIEEKWRCCPICMTIWDGEFAKRNPRYPDKPYDWTKPGYKSNTSITYSDVPRLVLEGSRKSDQSGWHLISHGPLTGLNGTKSVAVEIFSKFKEYIKTDSWYSSFRLKIVNKDQIRIIKEANI